MYDSAMMTAQMTPLMTALIAGAALAIGWAGLWAYGRRALLGDALKTLPASGQLPAGAVVHQTADSPELQAIIAGLERVAELHKIPPRQRIPAIRQFMEGLFAAEQFDADIRPVNAGGVAAEWVLAPGALPQRRMLYIHGGAFIAGSPVTHRRLTTRLSAMTGASVLSIDYRLLPEHKRMDGIIDCQTAYRWLLNHGPDAQASVDPPQTLWIAGDSAGGNLALMLAAWIRDQGLRAPDAVVAMSPLTDATLVHRSLRDHVATDPMLGPLFGPMGKLPISLLAWITYAQNRIKPKEPHLSPLRGSLHGLPPTLIQASTAEMLWDDARAYALKAQAAGSPVQLQAWERMVHVWQIYHPTLPEARDALDAIGAFLAESTLPRPLAITT